jgi:hypothetical protein
MHETMTRDGDGPRRRRRIRGTIARIGDLTMRYGRSSQLATLDCTSSRRSTVMCALPRAIAVTTVYQRDSSSKRPRSSVVSADRVLSRAGSTTWRALAGECPATTVNTLHDGGLDKGSFHIRLERSAQPPSRRVRLFSGRTETPSRHRARLPTENARTVWDHATPPTHAPRRCARPRERAHCVVSDARRPPATRGISAFAPVSRALVSGIPVALPMAVGAAIQDGRKPALD